ncbi:MAG: response regulator [Promethearchaeia archaeon]
MINTKILIVDDDQYVQRLYKLILAEIDIDSIKFASNGREAIKTYKSSKFDPELIIMDYRMPLMNGIDAMNEILNINKNEKIIFASADPSVKKRALSMGAVKFLTKPFDIHILLKTIKDLLKIKETLEKND